MTAEMDFRGLIIAAEVISTPILSGFKKENIAD